MLSFIISNAYAQDAAQGAPSAFMSMVPLIAVFFVFYFLMIRPQKKKMEQEQNFIANLQKGDEIYTKSGLIGKIYGMTDKVVTIEVEGGNKLKFLKSQVAGSTKDIFEEPNKDAAKK